MQFGALDQGFLFACSSLLTMACMRSVGHAQRAFCILLTVSKHLKTRCAEKLECTGKKCRISWRMRIENEMVCIWKLGQLHPEAEAGNGR